MSTEIFLTISVVAAGLWSGLLLTLTTILHPMFASRDDAGLSEDLHRFLPVARKSPTNYVLVAFLVLAPVASVVSLWSDFGSTAFVLAAVGTALTLIGPLAMSSQLAEPNYDVLLAWEGGQEPAEWPQARQKYFLYNWLRAGITWVAFACFIAATAVYVA
jgi:hypothetical protein